VAVYGFCLLHSCGIVRAAEKSWEQILLEAEQLQRQGSFAEAETALLGAMKEAEKFAPGDPRLPVTLYNLGSIYQDLGRPSKAETFYQRSLAAMEKSVGADHPSLARPLGGLVTLYLENGLYAKAERLHHRYSAVSVQADPAAPQFLHSLAALYHAQRRYAQAEPLYRQALAGAEKWFGEEDQEVARVRNNLALLYAKTGRRGEAITQLERALAISEQALGRDHPQVARALTNLAAMLCSGGRHAEAEPLFVRALTIAENSLGPENPLVGTILAEYAVLLRKTKRKAEATSAERRAQAIRENHAHEDLGRHTIGVTDLLTPHRQK
jgi:tetratricopeptide (TPR) repeat protein